MRWDAAATFAVMAAVVTVLALVLIGRAGARAFGIARRMLAEGARGPVYVERGGPRPGSGAETAPGAAAASGGRV